MKFQVGLPGRDELTLELSLQQDQITSASLTGIGCTQLLNLLVQWRPLLKGTLSEIPIPTDLDHASLLLKQLLLQAQGKWAPPYQDEELCHCRRVATQVVNAAIISGCHTPELVSKKTSASTSCGTCRPDVEAQIQYVLRASV